MYNKIRQSIKSCELTGWSYQMEEKNNGNQHYLSKFDKRQKRNNDEYKIFFEFNKEEVTIVDAYVVRDFTKRITLSRDNGHFKEAVEILKKFTLKQQLSLTVR